MRAALFFEQVLADFPCFVPTDANFRRLAGFVEVSGREFRVSVASDCSSFQADDQLQQLLSPCIHSVRDRLRCAATPHEFLLELRDLLECQLSRQGNDDPSFEKGLPPAHFYKRLLTEISQIGWDNVSALSESMRALDLTVEDSTKRKHTISVTLPAKYPEHSPKCVTSLPVEFDIRWDKHSNLVSILKHFSELVTRYQDFFLAMEDLDAHTWVLEPEHPTMRETYRRIALANHCSMRIEIDPRAPLKGFPDIRFLGSEAAIGPFKEHLNRNIHLWDTSGSLLPRQNLEKLLEVKLPTPPSQNEGHEEDMSLECGICYTYRLDDAVPDVACDLPECSKPYHRGCLTEWLRALPDTRESFGTIIGSCVYCEQSISVSLPR